MRAYKKIGRVCSAHQKRGTPLCGNPNGGHSSRRRPRPERDSPPYISLLLITFLLSGCSSPHSRLDRGQVNVTSAPQSIDQQQNSPVAKRFQEPAPPGQTAVESAIELSQKYATLSEEAAVLRRQNQDLITENRQLKEQTTFLDATLKQTQKELTQANDLLIEMHIELNNWKTSVLGFRDEMRESEIAQLEALLKILKILGAEATTESAQAENEASIAALSDEPAQPKSAVCLADKSQETSNQGEPNE